MMGSRCHKPALGLIQDSFIYPSFRMFFLMLIIAINLATAQAQVLKPHTTRIIKPGSDSGTYIVEITILHESLSSFVKVEEAIYSGATSITALKTEGASFNAVGDRLRFIWVSFPTEKETKVSYSFKCPKTPLIKGILAFIAGNEKVVQEIGSDKTIDDAIAFLQSPQGSAGSNSNSSMNESKAGSSGNQRIFIERTISAGYQQNEYIVTIKLHKANLTGFARVEEKLEAGVYKAELLSAGKYAFTFNDQKVKFVFGDGLPEKDSVITLQYLVVSESTPHISGRFNFLYNNTKQEVAEGGSLLLSDLSQKSENKSDTQANEQQNSIQIADIHAKVIKLPEPDEYLLKVSVVKQGIKGFGKVEVELIDPFRKYEALKSETGSLKREEQKLRFVFSALPLKDSLELWVKLIASDEPRIKASSFSYVNSLQKTTTITEEKKYNADEYTGEKDVVVKSNTKNDLPPANVCAGASFLDERYVSISYAPASNAGEFLVSIKLNSGTSGEGFTKIVVDLRNGEWMEFVEKAGANAMTDGKKEVKFIWVSLPKNQTLNIKFKVRIVDAGSLPEMCARLMRVENNAKAIYIIPLTDG